MVDIRVEGAFHILGFRFVDTDFTNRIGPVAVSRKKRAGERGGAYGCGKRLHSPSETYASSVKPSIAVMVTWLAVRGRRYRLGKSECPYLADDIGFLCRGCQSRRGAQRESNREEAHVVWVR